jgi:hypothetical protein
MLCGSCKNRRFGGTYRLLDHSDRNRRVRNNLAVTSNRGRCEEILYEVLNRATQRNISEESIPHLIACMFMVYFATFPEYEGGSCLMWALLTNYL